MFLRLTLSLRLNVFDALRLLNALRFIFVLLPWSVFVFFVQCHKFVSLVTVTTRGLTVTASFPQLSLLVLDRDPLARGLGLVVSRLDHVARPSGDSPGFLTSFLGSSDRYRSRS